MIFSTSRRSPASRDHAIFALLLETGLSVSALISLNLSDVDMRRGKIHLRLSDDEDCWLSLGDASKPLETYLREGRPEFHRVSGEPALFISQVGTRITRQGIWQILGYWGKQAGLPYILSPRLIRHTAVWRMTSSGRTIEQIQALIGHRNPLSTRALLYRLKRASLDQPR
jgi:integrase/recombinase XerD